VGFHAIRKMPCAEKVICEVATISVVTSLTLQRPESHPSERGCGSKVGSSRTYVETRADGRKAGNDYAGGT
jgi:hypothetical protein